MKDMELKEENREAIVKAFAETESPLGFYFAGELYDWDSIEHFDYMKKSSDGGCSWGQVEYAWYFNPEGEGEFVEKDEKMFSELIEKAVAQNNPKAIFFRGLERHGKMEYKDALGLYCMAAELGWLDAKRLLGEMFYNDDGVEKDLVQ